MSLIDHMETAGWEPKAQRTASQWFAERPEIVAQVRDAYEAGWSFEQIRQTLQTLHGYPFKDEKSVRAAVPR